MRRLVPVSRFWSLPAGAFADDQLGLMDHLGIQEFLFMGYCIGGPFALKLMERRPLLATYFRLRTAISVHQTG